jgi:UDP-glucose 4-epimerase
MRVIVTGGAGFIGSRTVGILQKMNHTVLIVDDFSTGRSENIDHYDGKVSISDITDNDMMEEVFSEFLPEAVIHLAAQPAITTSIRNPEKDLLVNSLGTLNVVRMSKKYGVKKFVFSSTSAVYKESNPPWGSGITEKWPCEPRSPYGINKLCAEHYVRTMLKDSIIFRYGNVYGPCQVSIGENQVVARALHHFLKGDNFSIVGSGTQKRDFVFVDDVAQANSEAITKKSNGTFNLCTGKSRSVLEILFEIENQFDVNGYEWDHRLPEDLRGSVYMSNKKFQKEFGFIFTPIHIGIEKTVDWWNNR